MTEPLHPCPNCDYALTPASRLRCDRCGELFADDLSSRTQDLNVPQRIAERRSGSSVEFVRRPPYDPSVALALDDLRDALRDDARRREAERLSWAALNDAQLVYAYMNGFCGVMAEVLHQMTGWPIVGLQHRYTGTPWAAIKLRCGQRSEPAHVGVMNPATGLFADARNWAMSRHEFLWGYPGYPTPFRRRVDYWHRYSTSRPFARHPDLYIYCAEDHVPRLLPGLLEAHRDAVATAVSA